MFSFPPSELLIGTMDGSIVMIQGTLAAGAVQRVLSMGPIIGAESHSKRSPWGGLYLARKSGLVAVSPSGGLEELSTSISGDSFDLIDDINGELTLGEVAFHRDFAFIPRGLVRDMRTGAWSTLSTLTNGTHVCQYTNFRWLVFVVGATTTFRLSLDDDGSRYTSYTWKSAPLRHPDGRRLEIAEVVIPLRSFSANASVAITVGGTTKTVSGLKVGRHVIRQRFAAVGEYLDVEVVPASNHATAEAPMIELVRLGTNARQIVT